MRKFSSRPKFISAILVVFVLGLFLMSCDDDDDAGITVCNLDNHEYNVELRDDSDDSLVNVKHLEEWYDPFDHCDTFHNVEEGWYYLVVLGSGAQIVDRSSSFHMDAGEHRFFNINTEGRIPYNSAFYNDATVSVCNQDDLMYHVSLKRSPDDSLVSDFELDYWQDASAHCIDFENLEEGSYYIEIEEKDDNLKAVRSDDFFLAPPEVQAFTINQDGELVVGSPAAD